MDIWQMFGQFGCNLCIFAQHRLYLLSCRELRGALLLLLQAQHGWAGAAAGMGAGGPAGWVQQNGAGRLPVEAVLCQPALQGQPADVCMWRLCFFSPNMVTVPLCFVVFFFSFFQGERHVPCRPVCTWVGHTPSHRGQLQVQEPRQISYPVLLLQGNSCTSIPFSLFCLVLVKRLMVADEIHSFIRSSIHPFIALSLLQLFHFLWAVNSWTFTKTRKPKFKILCVQYQQILMPSC